ncbi:MAG: hypothetical protein IT422_13885 [Pirellulaceae bacterium]|nr:hypothetical protein [Pirellulaceae bacterium]
MSIKDKIHTAKLAFAAGTVNADANGFLHVAGVGDIRLSSEFTASVGRSRQAVGTTARARWDNAVEAAMLKCRGNRRAAVNMVVRENPGLREALVKAANAKPVARPKPVARAQVSTVSHATQARWNAAIEASSAPCRTRAQAIALASRRNPQLRAKLVAEANQGRLQPAKATVKPTARATAKSDSDLFRQQLAQLMADGMSRRDAAKQLSETMGLSQPRQEFPDSYWDARKARYYS